MGKPKARNESERLLLEWLRSKTTEYPQPASAVLRAGSFYAPTPRPKNVKCGDSGRYYDNCKKLAEATGCNYCEGVALAAKHGLVKVHAWCIDPQANIIDPTWEEIGLAYLGLTEEEMAKFQSAFQKVMKS